MKKSKATDGRKAKGSVARRASNWYRIKENIIISRRIKRTREAARCGPAALSLNPRRLLILLNASLMYGDIQIVPSVRPLLEWTEASLNPARISHRNYSDSFAPLFLCFISFTKFSSIQLLSLCYHYLYNEEENRMGTYTRWRFFDKEEKKSEVKFILSQNVDNEFSWLCWLLARGAWLKLFFLFVSNGKNVEWKFSTRGFGGTSSFFRPSANRVNFFFVKNSKGSQRSLSRHFFVTLWSEFKQDTYSQPYVDENLWGLSQFLPSAFSNSAVQCLRRTCWNSISLNF